MRDDELLLKAADVLDVLPLHTTIQKIGARIPRGIPIGVQPMVTASYQADQPVPAVGTLLRDAATGRVTMDNEAYALVLQIARAVLNQPNDTVQGEIVSG